MTGNYTEIGAQLKKKRTEAGRALEDVSEELKVSTGYLLAIEEARINDLPSIVYYKLYVRSYAMELGLDPELLMEDIEEGPPPGKGEQGANNKFELTAAKGLKSQKTPQSSKEMSMTKLATIIAAVVFVGFIIIMYFVINNDEPELYETTDDVSDNYVVPPTEDSTIIETASPDLSILELQPQPPADLPMNLSVFIRQTSWLLVLADGDTVLNRNLEPGDTRRLTADYRFAISMGNPNGVELKLNDTLLGPLSETGRPIRNLEINQLNKSDYYDHPVDSSSDEY